MSGNGHSTVVDLVAELRLCCKRFAWGTHTGWCELPAGHEALGQKCRGTASVTAARPTFQPKGV